MTQMGSSKSLPLAQKVMQLEERSQLHEKQVAELGERLHMLEKFIHGDGPRDKPMPHGGTIGVPQ